MLVRKEVGGDVDGIVLIVLHADLGIDGVEGTNKYICIIQQVLFETCCIFAKVIKK